MVQQTKGNTVTNPYHLRVRFGTAPTNAGAKQDLSRVGCIFSGSGELFTHHQTKLIRVPWTLEDTDNWKETHRIGSYIWVSGGLLLIILFPFFELQTYGPLFAIIVTLLAIIPMGYSFYLYKSNHT